MPMIAITTSSSTSVKPFPRAEKVGGRRDVEANICMSEFYPERACQARDDLGFWVFDRAFFLRQIQKWIGLEPTIHVRLIETDRLRI